MDRDALPNHDAQAALEGTAGLEMPPHSTLGKGRVTAGTPQPSPGSFRNATVASRDLAPCRKPMDGSACWS